MLMKDCTIEKLNDNFVRITSQGGKIRINTRKERIGRHIEDYKARKDVENKKLEEAKKKAKELGLAIHHKSGLAKVMEQIKEALTKKPKIIGEVVKVEPVEKA